MAKLTKAQRRVLKRANKQDEVVFFDMATEIQRSMYRKMVQRGYLDVSCDWEFGAGLGVIDIFQTITLTSKGQAALRY